MNDTTSFGVAMVLRNPDNETLEINGLENDIGLSIDPETGVAVAGRKASVAVSYQDLLDGGFELPENIPDDTETPWLVTWTPMSGGPQTMKIVGTIPDKLGIVVLQLEAYRSR